MKLENFAILVRVNGITGQLILSESEQLLFSKLVIGTVNDTNGPASFVRVENIELPANPNVFKKDEA